MHEYLKLWFVVWKKGRKSNFSPPSCFPDNLPLLTVTVTSSQVWDLFRDNFNSQQKRRNIYGFSTEHGPPRRPRAVVIVFVPSSSPAYTGEADSWIFVCYSCPYSLTQCPHGQVKINTISLIILLETITGTFGTLRSNGKIVVFTLIFWMVPLGFSPRFWMNRIASSYMSSGMFSIANNYNQATL